MVFALGFGVGLVVAAIDKEAPDAPRAITTAIDSERSERLI